MTAEKVLAVCEAYREALAPFGFPAERVATHVRDPIAAAGHLLWMLTRIEDFVREDRTDKAMRWLGFVQGVLWARGIYSIDELKEHNRS